MATTTEKRQKIRDDHPDSWIAVEEGDSLLGKVIDVTEAWSDQRQSGSWYPLLTVEVEDATGYSPDKLTPAGLKLHCFGTVLYNEVMRLRPEVGERIAVVYKGTGEAKKRGQNPPELYALRVEGRKDQAQRAYARIDASDAKPSPDVDAERVEADEDIPF